MDKYISREAIIEELEEEIAMGDEFDEKDVLINKGLKIALKDIKRQPAADVQPIVYAHKTINVGRRSYCSNCGKLAIMEDFCSKCGAKVKEGDTNV